MSNLESDIKKLNESQREAVESIEGPILVVAGPGTGKTQVLAVRIANILAKTDVNPSNILCLTFTESGVTAMRKRLQTIIGSTALYVRIHTFHSFCNEIIQSFPEKFAFAKELSQLDDLTQIKFIQQILDEVNKTEKFDLIPFHDKFYYQSNILNAIQTLKREGVSPEKLEEICSDNLTFLEANKDINPKTGKPKANWTKEFKLYQKSQELSKIYKDYNSKLTSEGFYDYEDMILFVIEKFKNDEELLAYYQEKYLYILVDEYQDTNGSQNEVLRLLTSFDKSPNIFAVGDDDQAIFRFQGANVENLLFFERQFENVKTIPITINYRSSQSVLDLSESLIEHNKLRLNKILPNLNKKLKAGLQIPKETAEVFEFENNDSENAFVAKKIKELAANGVKYSDIAVFYRKHSDSEDLIETLLAEDVPIRIAAGKNSLNQIIIKQFITLIKLIDFNDENRNRIFFEVLFFDFLNLNRLDVFKLSRYAHDKKIPSYFELLSNEELLKDANISEIEKLKNLADKIVEWKSGASNFALINLIQKVAEESGLLKFVLNSPDNIEQLNSLNNFMNYVKNINKLNREMTLGDLISDLSVLEKNHLIISEPEIDVERDGVNLMTAHKSKGLEFKYVFIIKFYDKNWGESRSNSKDIKLPKEVFMLNEKDKQLVADDIEDERRLLFVALTRAKQKIYISYAKTYPSGNSFKEVGPSPFLNELDKKLIEIQDTKEYEKFDAELFAKRLSFKKFSPYSSDEAEYFKTVLNKFKLSASSLNEYIECPLKFKFNQLLKAPQIKNKYLYLGTAIHFALENLYRSLKNGENKSLEQVLAIYSSQLAKEFLSADDLKSIKIEGEEILTEYYNYYAMSLEAPAEVEYGFYDRDLFLEIPESEPIQLTGKLDKIEWDDKTSNTVRIVDYKTKEPVSQNAIKGETKSSDGAIFRQIVFYKLLTDLDKKFKPSPYASKYIVNEVQIDFLRPNKSGKFKKESFEINDNDINDLKVKINDVVKRIRNLEFDGSEEYPRCEECEYCKLLK